MTDQELERRLAKAMEHAAPDDLEGVLSRCEMRKGTVTPMKKNNSSKRRMAIAACLALLLAGGGTGVVYQQANAVASVVSLDVNPSIELKVNKNQKVISCTGLNEDGREVLAEMDGGADLKGAKLDLAANALVGALVRHGYLDSLSSAILISVEDKNAQRALELQQQLTDAVDLMLRTEASSANVVSQTLNKDRELEQLAKDNSISAGKAALVSRVLEKNSRLDPARLSALSVEELRDIEKMEVPALPIGRDSALLAALQYAGVTKDYQIDADVDPELDEKPAVYEVELYHNVLGELEYTVDAWTGKVLTGTRDAMKGQPANPNRVSEQQAITAALTRAGVKKSETAAVYTELDEENGRLVWEVEFYAGGMKYECDVDAVTGQALNLEKEKDDKGVIGGAEGPTAIVTASVTAAQAEQAALKQAGLTRKDITDLQIELDRKDGVWEVEFLSGGMEYEFEIDAGNGSVLSSEMERDDDDDNDDDHDDDHDEDEDDDD